MAKKLRIRNVNARENSVERFVARLANSHAQDYDLGAAGYLRDLCYGGCASGMVGGLIYTTDIYAFAKRHLWDIEQIVSELEQDMGSPLSNKDRLDYVTLHTWAAVELCAAKLQEELESEVSR